MELGARHYVQEVVVYSTLSGISVRGEKRSREKETEGPRMTGLRECWKVSEGAGE